MAEKARLFVGSSVEHLDIAYAVQEELDRSAEVTVWTQGIFTPSASTMESLLGALDSFDYALVVFAPDDIVRMRGQPLDIARDNVVFELGLLMGRLGQRSVFFLIPRDSTLHLPTDLLGLTPLTYDANRSDNNLRSAVGPACNQIRSLLPKIPPRATAFPQPPDTLNDNEAIATIAAWLDRTLLDVLTRPITPAAIDAELSLPSGTVRRLVTPAISRSTRALKVSVDTETRLQLSERR